ncbi:Ribosomal protein L51 mitochondrial [Trinorchestia longiramus]|nr:Ribosomal protein L51 mitochondrial [Trinorchestia longiramus]
MLHIKGLLPRNPETTSPLPMKVYAPYNQWSEKKALYGQNDYIDILGDGSLHPTDLMYGVPKWLRAFKANEFQVLIRQKKLFGPEMLVSGHQIFAKFQAGDTGLSLGRVLIVSIGCVCLKEVG